MAIFDISSHVIEGGRPRIQEIIAWLTENVGHYYGRGEDPVIHIGSGWEIAYDRDVDWEENYVTSWVLDITDDAKASYFALKWL